MAIATSDCNEFQQRIHQLETELKDARQKIADLERSKGATVDAVADPTIPISEFEETLKRLVQRIAMILQAEKCVIMIRDRETGDLIARSPAFGITDDEVKHYRVKSELGISGEVFNHGKPTIFQDADQDPRAMAESLDALHVRNGVTVPLRVEKRDDQNIVSESVTIGVLHCFNKRYGGEFIEEDVRLLERLSRNAAAIIANAQMFQEVVEERQKLVHTLESLTAGLIFINQHGRIGQINAQARAMFQVSGTVDPVSKPMEEIIRHDQCLAIIKRKTEEALNPVPKTAEEEEEERKQPDEITVEDKDGEPYIYQLHVATVRDDNNQPIGTVVIFNDITDIRNVERMKTEFVSVVSHELRTPLTPMKGFVRTLLEDENEEWYTREDRREFYGIIESNVDRLSRLISDLLNVSRIERGAGLQMNFEEVDLRKAAEEVVEIQKAQTSKHTLVIDFDPESIFAETDIDKIQNILQNLVSNAIKYAPNGGEVRIIGRVEPETETVLLGVQDHGSGIPDSAKNKMFKKFGRLDIHTKTPGTGIGLFLVKALVEAHRGKIWFDSEFGKGTTFWFRIPMKHPTEDSGDATKGIMK